MSAMRVQRYDNRQRRNQIGCGCGLAVVALGVVLLAAILLLIPALPAIGLRLAGFAPVGQTDALFAEQGAGIPVQIVGGVAPAQVSVQLGTYGTHTLPDDAGQVVVSSEQQMATASFTEADLMQLCQQMSALCSADNTQYRNVQFDLRNGGAVFYADVTVPGLGVTQRAGVVLRLRDAARFEVAGMDVGGTLYDVPPEAFGDLVNEVERTGNDILRQLSVQADGTTYMLTEVYISDELLTLVLR